MRWSSRSPSSPEPGGPGQIEDVWAVDLDGAVAVLIGTYYADTPQDAVDEMRAILGSMTFGVG